MNHLKQASGLCSVIHYNINVWFPLGLGKLYRNTDVTTVNFKDRYR